MEQKDYKLEIILELLKDKSHVRSLAKKLNINHMTILRKIKELEKENAIDYKKEGKNNVYALKKTIEAKSYIFKAETYKLLKLLKKYPLLRSIIENVQNDKRTKLAILFGSYAKDIVKNDSDIDLYIETDNRKVKEELQFVNSRLSIKIGKYDKNSLLIREIEKNHVIIKGVEEFYTKNEFFVP